MRKTLTIIIILIILAILVFLRLQCSRKGANNKEGAGLVLPVEVAPASIGDVKSSFEILGTIVARKTAQVFPETMGRITRIMVTEGAKVHKNSHLLAIRNESIGFEYEEGFIKSPITGVVGKIDVDVGSMVTPQSSVATIVDYSQVKIKFSVAETNMESIKKNEKVLVETDATGERVFSAKILEISPVIDPLTRTVSVKAVIDNPENLLKPGMTARVTVNLGERSNVLNIPKDALLEDHIFIVDDSVSQRRDVKIGLMGDENVEIIDGLSEGEKVVVIGQKRLAGGEKVKPIMRGK